ncbi:hypothetical protein ACFLUC_02580 [Chloroflexota bacterium]
MERFFYWTPRVLGLLFAGFISIFALDVFSEGYSTLETMVALFMHLIPTAFILIALGFAWRWERAGGIVFILIGAAFTVFFNTSEELIPFLLISAPVLLIGVLFLVHWYTAAKSRV